MKPRLSIEEAARIVANRREALRDLVRAVEDVLQLVNIEADAGRVDGTEDEFNVLRVRLTRAKDALR